MDLGIIVNEISTLSCMPDSKFAETCYLVQSLQPQSMHDAGLIPQVPRSAVTIKNIRPAMSLYPISAPESLKMMESIQINQIVIKIAMIHRASLKAVMM